MILQDLRNILQDFSTRTYTILSKDLTRFFYKILQDLAKNLFLQEFKFPIGIPIGIQIIEKQNRKLYFDRVALSAKVGIHRGPVFKLLQLTIKNSHYVIK